jgi:hypothetical protein
MPTLAVGIFIIQFNEFQGLSLYIAKSACIRSN